VPTLRPSRLLAPDGLIVHISGMTGASETNSPGWHGTTILAVRKNNKLVMMSDGQVSMGQTVMKGNARKVRRLADGKILAGFAGATADAFTLFERLETKLERHNGQLSRAAVELAKDWRTEKYLQKLEALLIVADKEVTLVLTGSGDVLEPEHDVVAVGSGGNYALSAARALIEYEDDAEVIGRKAMQIAADICVYTNANFTVETLDV
jgi:ATP-dependent HslUV protease subunit HslV